CGKCTPCRLGCPALTEVLDRIRFGTGLESDLDLINYTGKQIIEISLCGLGQAAPAPILNIVQNYRDEILAHINEGRCPAGQCPIEQAAELRSIVATPGIIRTLDDPYRVDRRPTPLPVLKAGD
ncbi:MAG: NADH-ubiquinone oxidoreductase-F iron-sulfur binding region domain-containing protein, partial [Thermomicrobiales bacterium]